MSGNPSKKEASALVYLTEELGDARLLCEQLRRYVSRAVELIEKSGKRDHFFEVAGDLLQSIPETTDKLHKALQAVALATNRLDYEEVKQDLRPEKVDELEEVLDEVRIRPVRRRGNPMPITPEQAAKNLRKLAIETKEGGALPLGEALHLIQSLEAGITTASTEKTAESLEGLAEALLNPPEGVEGPSRARLAAVLRQEVSRALTAEAVTAQRVTSRVLQAASEWVAWAEDKDGRMVHLKGPVPKSVAQKAVKDWADKEDLDTTMSPLDQALRVLKPRSSVWFSKLPSADKKALEALKSKTASDEAADDKVVRSMNKVIKTIEANLKDMKSAMGKYKSDPQKYAPQLNNFADDVRSIGSAIRVFERSSGKTASDEEKEARFEEGKPADPTKNMSPEDAKKWKENVDHDGSNIKKEAASLSKDQLDLLRMVARSDALSVPPVYQDTRKSLIKKGLLANFPGLTAGASITREGAEALKSGKYAAVTASDWKVGSEKSEMQVLLKKHGYDPKDASKLMKESIGPEELRSRLKNKPGAVGSLEYTHGLKKKAVSRMASTDENWKVARDDYSKIKPGAEVTVADNHGRKQTGIAQKKTPAGWTVEVNGRDTIATPDNTVAVKTAFVDPWKA